VPPGRNFADTLMVKRASLDFSAADSPITELVTKFGGQPVWLGEPQWPLSRATGQPMLFIGQVALAPELFGDTPSRMAYLFITDDRDEYVDGTWEADSGENAVILQPGLPGVPTQPLTTGPTLYDMRKVAGEPLLQPVPVEFAVQYRWCHDPVFVTEGERCTWPDDRSTSFGQQLDGNKVGGTPGFMQGDEFPGPGQWRLLLQLDAMQVPFYINFGDAGIGYAFLSEDGRTAKFLWQCA
jgi:hypothetical protein